MSNNISYNPPYAVAQPGGVVRANGGGGHQVIGWRSALDARRTMQGQRTPQAEYPDGYLGTIVDRQKDKLLENVQSRLTQRSYQRGVHKGDKIDQRDYYWPDEFTPQTGLEYEAQQFIDPDDGRVHQMKWRAAGAVEERLVNRGKNAPMASPAEIAAVAQRMGIDPQMASSTIDPVRADRIKRLLPNWR